MDIYGVALCLVKYSPLLTDTGVNNFFSERKTVR